MDQLVVSLGKWASSVLFVLTVLLAAPVRAASSVDGLNGNIVCLDARGHRQAITSRGGYDLPVLSSDGHTVAFLHEDQGDTPDGKAGALWVGDCLGHNARRLLPSMHRGDGNKGSWGSLGAPSFSLDGRFVYVSAYYGGDSGMVHRVDARTGIETYVFPAELIGVIHNGPYRGDLLATQHTLLKDGDGAEYGGYPIYVFTDTGKEVLRIPDSEHWTRETLGHWLKKKGWKLW